MMLEFENTMDDIVAFQLYHLANSSTVRRKLRVRTAVIIVALGTAIFLATGSWRDAVVPVAAGTLLGYLILRNSATECRPNNIRPTRTASEQAVTALTLRQQSSSIAVVSF
jgi:hypothetical protein